MPLRMAIVLVLLAWCGAGFAATTYEVGPGKPFVTLAALPALGPGDVVQISAGTYNEVKRWTASGTAGNPITIRGVAGTRPVIDAAGKTVDGAMPNPRAVFQIEASHIVIEHLDFTHADNNDNGAGVRVTGSGLTGVVIRDCRMYDNDMGIMSDRQNDLLIEYCDIFNNGDNTVSGGGFSHNLYMGGVNVTVRGCSIRNPKYAQNFKSRAHFTALLYNYIANSQDGEVGLVDHSTDTTSANSNAVMIGNIVVSKFRDPAFFNTSKFVDFGSDVGNAHNGTLYAYNNTFISGQASNIFLKANRPESAIVARNNIFIGSTNISNGSVGTISGANNWLPTGATVPAGFTGSVFGSAPGFVTANTDVHLLVGAAARNIGLGGSTYLDGTGVSRSGVPGFTFEGVGILTVRSSDGTLDAGAYEYVAPGGVPELDVTRGGAVVDGSTDSVTGTTAGMATNLTYTLTNSGTATLTMSGATTFASAVNCTVSITTQPNSNVTASNSTALVVAVTPTVAGAWSFTLNTPNTDGNENPYNWTVSGTATAAPAAELDVTRAGVAVADGGTDTVTGSTAGIATSRTYALTNSGSATLSITAATTFASASNCTVSITTQPASSVAASAATNLVVAVTPSAAGAWSFTLSTANTDSNENPYNWTVAGTATAAAAPELDVTRASVAVSNGSADNVLGTTAGVATIVTYVFSNNGTATLTITGATILTGQTNCTATITTQPTGSVAASASTSLVVSITPTTTGAWSFGLSTPNTDSNENPYAWTVSSSASGGSTTKAAAKDCGFGSGIALLLGLWSCAFTRRRLRVQVP